MQHIYKFGLAAMVFFMGTALPMAAQDEAEGATEVAQAPKKQKKAPKKYPTIAVSGTIIDGTTGEPLAGAQIQAFNNKNYTAMTDENGNYTIQVPKFVTSLTMMLDGYNPIRTTINGRQIGVDGKLYSEQYLDDYLAQPSAAVAVEMKNIQPTTAVTVDEEIQNRLGADVRAITRSAAPGQGMSMFINGLNSLNSNAQPLIVLDGVIFDQMYETQMLHTGYYNNLLQAINPEDIESVQVLKNGTAIYGAKAANGVILINTKRCRSMATRIDVNLSAGIETRPMTMDMMGAEEYRSYAAQLLGSTPTKLQEFKFLNNDPNYYYYNMYHNNTNWKDEVYREAWRQNYGIAIQGGDDIAKYNLSVGFTDQQSTLRENKMQRFNIRFNTDIELNKWFTTKFDASYTNVTRDLRDNGLASEFNPAACASTSFLALAKAPFLSPYDFSTDGKVSTFIADADTYLDEVLGSKASLANPKAILATGSANNKNSSDCTMINIGVTPKWQPTKNFYMSEHFAYTMQSFDEAYFTPIVGMPTFTLPGSEAATENTKNSLYSKHTSIFSDTRIDWTILPNGPHHLELFGGMRFMSDTFTSSYITGDNTGNDKTPNNSMSQVSKKGYGQDTSWKSMTYYLDADYNYQERFYLKGQIAMETSSRFGKEVDAGLKIAGVKWGFFPSIQGSWVISNEKWFRPNKGVNNLKLNVGFESVGNDGIDNSATLTYLASSAAIHNATTSLGLGNIGNSSLRWETTNRLNAGFEGTFLNSRLNVRFNYFNSTTSNLVTLGTLAYVAGLRDYYTNDGALKNQGFDVAFNAKVVDEKNFKFELGASIGHYKNELTKLPQGQPSFETNAYGATILSEVGRSAGVFYGYKTDGVFATSAEAQAANLSVVDAAGNKTAFAAGDMRFVDTDGNGIINEADRQVIGDPTPDIFGNISLRFNFCKNWSLNANFNYSLGNDVYNYQRAILESGSMFLNQTTAVNRRWMNEGQKTDIPRITYNDPMGNSRFSDRWIEDGSYLKLKNVTLQYRIPLNSPYIQGVSVWVAANNLFTVTRYLGADPEVSCSNSVLFQGIDAGYVNYGRSFHLGVKINL